MNQPLLRDAAILIQEGKIASVGLRRELLGKHGDAKVEELGNRVLLPGLVNPHVHLELSLSKSPTTLPAGGFVGWIKQLMSQTVVGGQAAVAGVSQCIRFGVTTVGDISRQCDATRQVLRESPLRVISFGEIQAMATRRHFLEERLATATDLKWQRERLSIAVSPHAPYSIERHGYERCLAVARQNWLPLATHLAENPLEGEFLEKLTGPFRELWDWLGAWDQSVPKFVGGPVRYAKEIGLLDYPSVLAHVNYCDDSEMGILATGQASVVYCPRTHRYFGHPPHRFREMLARGINVAIGTDSCASSPDLNLMDDLRLVKKIAPEFSSRQIWEMGTVRAARALGLEKSVGSLKPGTAADVIAFDVTKENPLDEILENSLKPSHVWIGGELLSPISGVGNP